MLNVGECVKLKCADILPGYELRVASYEPNCILEMLPDAAAAPLSASTPALPFCPTVSGFNVRVPC